MCAKEIFKHCAIGRSMVMAAQNPPQLVLRYMRYLTVGRHSFSNESPIPWIISKRLLGLRCEGGGLSRIYWGALNKSLPSCMVNLVHLSLKIDSFNVSAETSDAFHAAMAKLSRSVREISLDLLGWTREVSFALYTVQREFGDLRSIQLTNLTHEIQGRVLNGQYWRCRNELEELSLRLSVFSMRDLLEFLHHTPRMKKATICRCFDIDWLSPNTEQGGLVQRHRC